MSILNNSGPTGSCVRQTKIARFDPVENSWTELGKTGLNKARSGHGVIQVDNEFVVVGGNTYTNIPSESCKLDGQLMTCAERKPSLSVNPELMLILA